MRVLLALLLTLAAGAAAAAPARVVSINLCTDQMAMLLAAPGQLVSVSTWAARPRASAMAEAARAYPANGGTAEEVHLLRPDLVLAGDYSARATVAMLRRLGVRVESFAPERSFADIRANLRRMGRLLGREAEAERVIAGFDADLAALRAEEPAREEAAFYYANAITSGSGTLADDVLDAAGLDNLAARLGIVGVGALPLETLVLERPMLARGASIAGGEAGRAFETLSHPALDALGPAAGVEERWQTCGGPFTLNAVRALAEARRARARD